MGSRLIKTETIIDAPAERVWAEMTDFASFPEWNPFVRQAEGRLEPGEQLKIRLRLDRGLKLTFKPRVTVVEPGRELRWLRHPRPAGCVRRRSRVPDRAP